MAQIAFCGEQCEARHERRMAQRVSLRLVHSGTQQRPENSRTSPSAEAAPSPGAATAPRGHLCPQAIPAVLRDLGLTPNQVWGLTKTDDEWSAAVEAALTAARRHDLKHGTNAAYVRGCVCSDCREHQRIRWRGNLSSSPRNELPAPMDRKETRPPGLIKPPKRTYQDGVANLARTDFGA
jgi:hypothetical protein